MSFDIVEQLDEVVIVLPRGEAAAVWLEAATLLLRCRALTHPECVDIAGTLIRRVLVVDPRSPDAWRTLAWHTWIRYCQGGADACDVDEMLTRARLLGPVSDFKPPGGEPDEQHRALASAFAGTRTLEGLDLEAMVELIPIRPDMVDPLLDEVERRLSLPDIEAAARQRRRMLDVAVRAVALAAGLEEEARRERVEALIQRCGA